MGGIMRETARLIFYSKGAKLVTEPKALTLISVWGHAESLLSGSPKCCIMTQESD